MIGTLNKRITLQESAETPDGAGGVSLAWQSIAVNPSVYASITPLSGGEQWRYHQLENTVTHRIVLRYRDDLTARMRILHGTTPYDIHSIINLNGEGQYVEILASVKE